VAIKVGGVFDLAVARPAPAGHTGRPVWRLQLEREVSLSVSDCVSISILILKCPEKASSLDVHWRELESRRL
jgi:hypothetical protein